MNSFHLMPNPVFNPLSAVRDRVSSWAVESQQGARRNAMVATTALAARRAEREDVDDYFAAMSPARPPAQLPATARH